MLIQAQPPKDRTALRGFLALLQQFRTMLVHLSHACHKLYELTSTKTPYVWTDEHNKAFLIPDTDWPVDEQDPLELDSLFPFKAFTTVSFPVIEKHLYSSVDFEEFNRSNLVITEKNQQFTTVIHGVERVLVPTALRRSVFWAAHFPTHFGLSRYFKL